MQTQEDKPSWKSYLFGFVIWLAWINGFFDLFIPTTIQWTVIGLVFFIGFYYIIALIVRTLYQDPLFLSRSLSIIFIKIIEHYWR